ncbi:energy transducer TonB [Sphingomonas sp. SAFR-052]|uniref:energy transducer TonB n=1 Tax=Sphingomonas sp. SAFR-052 TaxID=3436867 RepID=UPI003F803884
MAQTDPVAIDPGSWVTASDYPASALAKRQDGVAGVYVEVDRHGRPADCRLITSTDNALLDAATCRLIMRRGKFTPALDAKGKKVAGQWLTRFIWSLPPQTPPRVPLRSYAVIERFTLDGSGKISGCTSRESGESGIPVGGCYKPNGEYLVQRSIGSGFVNGTLIHVGRREVEQDPLPADAPDTDVPPYWTLERTLTAQPDGSVVDCVQRDSAKATIACEWLEHFLPIPDGKSRRVRTENRWSFQPKQ